MPFDPTTAIPVIERPDGLIEKDTFNPATATPVSEIPQLRHNPNKSGYSPPLTDQDKARALVERLYKEEGKEIPLNLKVDWALTSEKARAVTAAGMNTMLTGGLYPVVQGLRGIADNKQDYTLLEAATKGILYPDQTKRLTDPLMADNAPTWAKITQSVSEDILSYGVAGIAKGYAKTKLIVRDLARKLDKAATEFATEKVGSVTATEGVASGQVATLAKRIDQVKAGFVDDALLRMSATDTGTMTTGFQDFAKSRSMVGMLADEINSAGLSRGLYSNPIPVIGQKVSFMTDSGKAIVGKITEINGNQAIIDMEGRQVIAMLSQLRVPVENAPGGVDRRMADVSTENKNRLSDWTPIIDAYDTPEGKRYQISKLGVSDTVKGKLLDHYGLLFDKGGVPSEKVQGQGGQEKVLTQPGADTAIAGKPPVSSPYEPAFSPNANEDQKLIEFKGAIQGEGFQVFSPKQMREVKKFVAALPENVSKREAIDIFKKVESKLSKDISPLEVKNIVREATGQIKEQGGNVSERTAYLQSLKDRVKAASQAERFTKEEVFNTQRQLTDLIEKSDLTPEDKAKFLTSIKNVQTGEDLQKVLSPTINKKGKEVSPGITKRINDLIEKAQKKSLASDIKKINTDNIAIDYKQAIEKMQNAVDLNNRTDKTIAKREKIKEFVDKLKAEGRDITIPEKILSVLDKPTLKDVTVEELTAIKKNIEQLAKLGKTKIVARENVYKAKKEKIKNELLKSAKAINSKEIPNVPIGGTRDQWAERYIGALNYIERTKVGLTPMEGMADITGMQEMKKALDNKFGEYLSFNDENFKKWYAITKDFNEGNFRRIGAYAISQQEGGIERLANSGITGASNIELTPEEQKAYELARETFDSYFPDVQRYVKEVYNEDVGQVKNYVSFISDFEQMSDLEMYDRFGQRPQEAINRRTKTVEQGFTKERAATSNIKIETNIDKIFRRHLDDVGYMLTMGKDIKMYSEVLNAPDLREALGDIGTLAWKQWLDLMARKGGVDSAKRINALDILRRNTGAGVLAFRVSSALVQFSSFGDTMATIGAEWAMRGASNIANSKEWRDFIMNNFPEVRKAVGDDVAFREFGEDMFGKMARIGFKPLQALDGIMRSTAASGAYEKISAERGIPVDLNNPNIEIIQEATKIMRQSQGSSFFKDQPLAITAGYGLSDNNSLNKTLLQFQSFMLGRWDNINRQIFRLGIQSKDYNKAFMSLFWLTVFGFAGEVFMRRTANAITGKKKNKKSSLAGDVAINFIQAIPLVGQLVSAITYSSNPVPIIKTTEDVIEGAGTAFKGKKKSTRTKGALKAVGGAGSLGGIPGASQATQLINERIKTRK